MIPFYCPHAVVKCTTANQLSRNEFGRPHGSKFVTIQLLDDLVTLNDGGFELASGSDPIRRGFMLKRIVNVESRGTRVAYLGVWWTVFGQLAGKKFLETNS